MTKARGYGRKTGKATRAGNPLGRDWGQFMLPDHGSRALIHVSHLERMLQTSRQAEVVDVRRRVKTLARTAREEFRGHQSPADSLPGAGGGLALLVLPRCSVHQGVPHRNRCAS